MLIEFNTAENKIVLRQENDEMTEIATYGPGDVADYLAGAAELRTYAERLQDIHAMGWAAP